jgi:Protein of unknown function (DUF1631)
MSSKNDSSNIVILPTRHPVVTPVVERLSEPLKSLRDLALKRLGELVNTLFENIDDALFDLAERAQSNTVQNAYFDGMREVRKKRERVQIAVLDKISQTIAAFASGAMPSAPKVEKPAGNTNIGLSLVEDQDLEESLAVSGMIGKAESRFARQLYALNRRLSAIRGGVPVENLNNPIGPALLCDAFQLAAADLDLELHSKLIVFKLFDRYVICGVELLYDEVNELLIQNGVLPQLRHHITQQQTTHRAAAPHGSAENALESGARRLSQEREGDAATAASNTEQEIYQTLRSLLAIRHEQHAPQAEVTQSAPASFGAMDLLSALQILQSELEPVASGRETVDARPSARQLKQTLLDQAHKLHSGHAHMASVDEDTIDLVGMLFEFIVQDRDLPAHIQALLGRLQIPYLKVALLDRHLFTQKNHPARQLLDHMATACLSKPDESGVDQPLHDKIKATVEMILRDFDDDLAPIERANVDFVAFLEETQHRADLIEKRTTESVHGRERLEHARSVAASEIHERCAGKHLPALVHTLLVGPWTQFVVLVALRQGGQSVEWKQALSLADAMIWSVAPKTTQSERTRLANLLPSMQGYLRQGLLTIGYHDDDITRLLDELNATLRARLEPAREEIAPSGGSVVATDAYASGLLSMPAAIAPKPAEKLDENSVLAALMGSMETIVLSSEGAPAPAEAAASSEENIAQVKAMRVGDWVEFTRDNGHKERAKLSWISPISSKYLFVDRQGLKVADKLVMTLAAELQAGTLVLVEQPAPLFDRALGAVVERLKSEQRGARAELAQAG